MILKKHLVFTAFCLLGLNSYANEPVSCKKFFQQLVGYHVLEQQKSYLMHSQLVKSGHTKADLIVERLNKIPLSEFDYIFESKIDYDKTLAACIYFCEIVTKSSATSFLDWFNPFKRIYPSIEVGYKLLALRKAVAVMSFKEKQ